MPDAPKTGPLAPLLFTRERPILVRSTKYDGSLHYEFSAYLLDAPGSLLRCWIPRRTPWRGYRGAGEVEEAFTALFFTDRWYNLFHNHRPQGRRAIETYANVGLPAVFDGKLLTWVDLDLDVLRGREGVVVDDEDEFAEHRVRMGYPEDLAARALEATSEVTRLLHAGEFPCDRAAHLPAGVESLPDGSPS
jgi:uncharacterized protein